VDRDRDIAMGAVRVLVSEDDCLVTRMMMEGDTITRRIRLRRR
jgi:hypothetical protein